MFFLLMEYFTIRIMENCRILSDGLSVSHTSFSYTFQNRKTVPLLSLLKNGTVQHYLLLHPLGAFQGSNACTTFVFSISESFEVRYL